MTILEEIKDYVIECPQFYGIDVKEDPRVGLILTCSDGESWNISIVQMNKDRLNEKQVRKFAESATMMSHIIRADNADKEAIMEILMHPILSLGFEDV